MERRPAAKGGRPLTLPAHGISVTLGLQVCGPRPRFTDHWKRAVLKLGDVIWEAAGSCHNECGTQVTSAGMLA